MNKKIKLLMVCLTLATITATGCGEADKSKETKTDSENKSTTSTVAKEAEYVNNFDVKTIASSIKINDQEMGFPIDMTKLKDSITVGESGQVENTHFFSGVLLDGETGIGSVEIYSESDEIETDGFIYSFEVSEGSPWYISIGNVTFGAGIDEVKASIGTPLFENGSLEDTYRVYYENCEYEYLAFTFKQGTLKTISFSYLPEEWREK